MATLDHNNVIDDFMATYRRYVIRSEDLLHLESTAIAEGSVMENNNGKDESVSGCKATGNNTLNTFVDGILSLMLEKMKRNR